MPVHEAIFPHNETDESFLYEHYTTATYRPGFPKQSTTTVHASLSPVLNTLAVEVAGSTPIKQLTGIYLLENHSAIPGLG